MSFDIHLFCFDDGEPISLPSDEIRRAFEKNGVTEYGDPVYVELDDGFSLEIWSGGLNSPEGTDSVMFAIRSISRSVTQLLFDLVSVPRVMALVAASPALPFTSNRQVAGHIPDVGDEWAPLKLCGSLEELEQSLLPMFGDWEEWAFNRDP
nr:hypothetical protein [uncultured bacterium]